MQPSSLQTYVIFNLIKASIRKPKDLLGKSIRRENFEQAIYTSPRSFVIQLVALFFLNFASVRYCTRYNHVCCRLFVCLLLLLLNQREVSSYEQFPSLKAGSVLG